MMILYFIDFKNKNIYLPLKIILSIQIDINIQYYLNI
jgi:hypothetical protein